MKYEGKIGIITGNRGVGKTYLCQFMIRTLKKKSVRVSGIITPGRYDSGKKNGIDLIDILEKEKPIKFATYYPGWNEEEPQRIWKFEENAMVCGNAILEKSVPTPILIIDEMGYLEFKQNNGFSSAFEILKEKKFDYAFVVIRPELIKIAQNTLKPDKVFYLSTKSDLAKIKKEVLDYINIDER